MQVPEASSRLVAFSAVLLMAGCTQVAQPGKVGNFRAGTAELGYVAPRGHDVSPVTISGGTAAEAVAVVAAELRKAGLKDVRVDLERSVVSASSRSPQFLDCGVLVSGSGKGGRFAATTARSAIPVPAADPSGFVWRGFTSLTDFQVAIVPSGAGFEAQVAERHEARLTLKSTSENRELERESIRFSESQGGRFSSGLTCVSAGLVRRILD